MQHVLKLSDKDQNKTIETTETVKMITSDTKQLLDEVFVISGIMKVEENVIGQCTYKDLDYSGYHQNQI